MRGPAWRYQMEIHDKKRFRIFIPRFANFNIYTIVAKTTTSIGPLYVATAAAKLNGWDVEVIDENNLHGRFVPRTHTGELDHHMLQAQKPAHAVGFYGSISSSIPRMYELAKWYQSIGCVTLAGGKHVENMQKEALENGIDYVFLDEAEISISNFLSNFSSIEERNKTRGIAFLSDGELVHTEHQPVIENLDKVPIPDYTLLRFAKMRLFPICGTRGCNSNCEFCAVKGKSRSCTAERMMENVQVLVEKFDARKFFDVSDHFAANMDQAIRFLNMFAEYQEQYGIKLHLTVQTRITDARSDEYLKAIKRAGVDILCIGFESPIDEELQSMNKGYLSKDMLEWTRKFKKMHARIHGMFIFGYPLKEKQLSIADVHSHAAEYWRFIRKSNIDTLQILLAIPLPGTGLRDRLGKSGRLFPVDHIGWEYYDGQYPLYNPGPEVSPEMLQQEVGRMNKRFYGVSYLFRIIKNIILDFPVIVFPSVFTLLSGKMCYMKKAFGFWYRKFYINNILRFGGSIIAMNWFHQFRKGDFIRKLKEAVRVAQLRHH